jgi:hypothetical protein
VASLVVLDMANSAAVYNAIHIFWHLAHWHGDGYNNSILLFSLPRNIAWGETPVQFDASSCPDLQLWGNHHRDGELLR